MPKAAPSSSKGKAAAHADPLSRPVGRPLGSEPRSNRREIPSGVLEAFNEDLDTFTEDSEADASSQDSEGDASTQDSDSNTSGSAASVDSASASDAAASQFQGANADTNYLLFSELSIVGDPFISRMLSVPSSFTFAELHKVMQIAFGWANEPDYHAHKFEVTQKLDRPKDPLDPRALQSCQIIEEDTEIEFSKSFMKAWGGWSGRIVSESKTRLRKVFESPEFGGDPCVTYIYDFGDDWKHKLSWVGTATPQALGQMSFPQGLKAWCLGGEGHPAAEDCGGTTGWQDLKQNFAEPQKVSSRGDRRKWYKTHCMNGEREDLNPYKWDVMETNYALAREFSPDVFDGRPHGFPKSKAKAKKRE